MLRLLTAKPESTMHLLQLKHFSTMCLPIPAFYLYRSRSLSFPFSWSLVAFTFCGRFFQTQTGNIITLKWDKEWIRDRWRSAFFRTVSTLVRLQCEVQNAFLIVRFGDGSGDSSITLMLICCFSAVSHALKFHNRWSMHTIQPPLVMRHFVRKVCSHNFRNKIAFTSVLIQLNYVATSIKIVGLGWVNAGTCRGNCYAL